MSNTPRANIFSVVSSAVEYESLFATGGSFMLFTVNVELSSSDIPPGSVALNVIISLLQLISIVLLQLPFLIQTGTVVKLLHL